jgi:uncharacterized membrane protein
MKTLIGVLMCAAGIVLGLYVGVWICLVGGIVDIINEVNTQIQANGPLDAMNIAIGVIKIMFAGIIGMASAFVLIVPGSALMTK